MPTRTSRFLGCAGDRRKKIYPADSVMEKHLFTRARLNLLQNVTRYVIPEACANIAYSIVHPKRDAFRDDSRI
jgi:hypothetical protein